jgi:aspartyl-tRNA(Asn)/glutamyl-tRNA(Gln) amidotransferase subunit B
MKLESKLEPVIGLEIHLQPKTKSKMFCSCSADIWKAEPNSKVCPVCLGYPGALPVPNAEAIRKCQMLGSLLCCTISSNSKFDRKNYFYPDLPKGYQITQYDQPLCTNGEITLSDNRIHVRPGQKIRIRRVHMEEDTGKSLHTDKDTMLDFNKSGMPLIEIVTEPDFIDPYEVYDFGFKIREIVRQYGISDCDMEKGQMRLEASISMRPEGQKELPGYRVEIKNINSFRFARDALFLEIRRQSRELSEKNKIGNETRGYDEEHGTFLMREKEGEKDYRYFPEPDIPPMSFSIEYLSKIEEDIKKKREEIKKENSNKEIKPHKEQKVYTLSKDQILSEVNSVVVENSKLVDEIRRGKTNATMFLVGLVVKRTEGLADPVIIKEKLLEVINFNDSPC